MEGDSKDVRPATVVFVDDGRMATFYQFATRLGRLGMRVVRITTKRDAASMMASRLVFDRCVALPEECIAEALRSEFSKENVIDVQFAETLKELVSSGLSSLDPSVSRMVQRRIEVMDKEYAGDMISSAGVATPPHALFSEMDAREFAARYGFPVVIKDRTGYGGLNVKIVKSSEELDVVAANYRGLESAYLEKYIEGDKVNFGAVLGSDGVILGLCYKTHDWVRPFGPSSEIEVYEDSILYEAGRKAVEAVGVPGLVNVNFMRDAQGALWAIDLNARVFGGIATFLACGVDLTAGYSIAIGIKPAVQAKSTVKYIRTKVFPSSLAELVQQGRIVPLMKEFAIEAVPYWRWLGPRYILSETLATLGALSNARH